MGSGLAPLSVTNIEGLYQVSEKNTMYFFHRVLFDHELSLVHAINMIYKLSNAEYFSCLQIPNPANVEVSYGQS